MPKLPRDPSHAPHSNTLTAEPRLATLRHAEPCQAVTAVPYPATLGRAEPC